MMFLQNRLRIRAQCPDNRHVMDVDGWLVWWLAPEKCAINVFGKFAGPIKFHRCNNGNQAPQKIFIIPRPG